MSYEDAFSAINLEMPPRVPRTEYSVERHWPLICQVTGLNVNERSSDDDKLKAQNAFMRAWDYGFIWNVLIGDSEFGDWGTKMGHAEYAAGGEDFDQEVICPYKTPEDVLGLDPWEKFGAKDKQELIKRFEDNLDYHQKAYPDFLNTTGIYVTMMSGLIAIFGWDMLLLAAGTDLEGFGEVANRYANWVQQYFDALAAADVPVVMVHDDIAWTSGPFLAPEWYRKYIFPNYRKLLAPLLASGKRVLYTSDGNYTTFIDDIAGVGVHGFVMEPVTDMQYVAEKYGKTHVFVGNADTRILLSGSKSDIRNEVQRCMDIGKKCPGFFMAVGNQIPANTPIENAFHYNSVFEEFRVR